jgi:general transcription factor 3C polypeptide 4
MLPGSPKDLSVEAQDLANKVRTFIPQEEHDGTSSGLQDRCPACGVGVPLTDVAVAVCSNGHRWRESSITSEILPLIKLMSCWSRGGPHLPFLLTPSLARCSVTSFILSTTMVQTCLGCARKSFLPAMRPRYQKDGGEEMNSDVGPSDRTTAEDPRTVSDSDVVDVLATGRGWVMQEVLNAVRRCLFCGNNFAILL